ncbi:MAG: DUF4254 domain-containing protein [Eubacterium sp.]|nr:DUF4254 domain-containing protein [Eubacterium sp.]
MVIITANRVISLIQEEIAKWHIENENRKPEHVIVTDEIRRIKPLNEHRDNIEQVIRELTITNTEMWHEEDKVRSMKDEVVLRAIRNINPLNQHRNDLMEEVDEIVLDNLNQ